ncbi:MAG TPA: TIGR03620 family F420-dependent LLM class oxidoreductase [Pseudonocardiaceae bacterium]|jgi:probable F420-dependent oxidoreductase|nr:TIGR03620 family F420-dependent LLM class oxidoreductase [Pseudonocardiaceae bacterium]
MGTTTSTRRALGRVGVFPPISFARAVPIDDQRDAVRRLERAGYRTAWTNEVVGGKDALVQLAVLLAATERMTFGTGIANIWVRQPETLHGAAALLAQAYPDRLVLGLGVGYPAQAQATGREFGKPLTTMREYLGKMTAQTWPPAADAVYPRIIGANGPKMLALAGEIADGALPIGLPVEHTAQARRALGPDKLLVVGLSVVLDADPGQARETARSTVSQRLAMPAVADGLARLGYGQDELARVSDRVVDAVIAHGEPAAIAAGVQAHLDAGADHVALLPTTDDYAEGVRRLVEIAPAFIDFG